MTNTGPSAPWELCWAKALFRLAYRPVIRRRLTPTWPPSISRLVPIYL